MKQKVYDIGIGWANPSDRQFVERLTKKLRKEKISYKEITYVSLKEDYMLVEKGALTFNMFLDRSSDDFGAYLVLGKMLKRRGTCIINDPDSVIHHTSKAYLHRLYEKENMCLPLTYIISPKRYSERALSAAVKKMRSPFVLKPSYGGGGEGVKTNARDAADIVEYLEENCADECIAQEYIIPKVLYGRSAWFRPVFVCGTTIPLWWNPANHYYHEFSGDATERKIAPELTKIVLKVAALTGLRLFSAEIVIRENGDYLVMDYANHPIDLNSQEIIPDGLPPKVLDKIVIQLVSCIKKSG